MPQMLPPTTQRAYTLRLQGTDRNDPSWREALWRTHEAVNRGAQVFGDWLLTLRGGLDHALAEAPTSEATRDRRILLALSWLSVESERGAPEEYVVAGGTKNRENADVRGEVLAAFKEILRKRGLSSEEIEAWEEDCSASLSAAIREDAVWVDRSRAFDDAVLRIGSSLTREEIWDMLAGFFNNDSAYLASAKGTEEDSSGQDREESKDLVKRAGHWLSGRFGTGTGADFGRMARVYPEIAAWAETFAPGASGPESLADLAVTLKRSFPSHDAEGLKGLLALIGGPGYKSATRNRLTGIAEKEVVIQEDLIGLAESAREDAEKCRAKTGNKGRKLYSDRILQDAERACGLTYLTDKEGRSVPVEDCLQYGEGYAWGTSRHAKFAVMLDHAARRVSMAHSWIKRAEAERRRFEEDAAKMAAVPPDARAWLDAFRLERTRTSGALEPYRIRRRAVEGWKQVVDAWSGSACRTPEDRIAAARALQDDPRIDKFGDIQLFEALAEDEALCVWHENGAPDARILLNYQAATEAEFDRRRFKVPAYRHPDPLLHPVFCDFGESRWDIRFDIHQKGKKSGKTKIQRNVPSNPNGLAMEVWDGNTVSLLPLRWQSKRLAWDLAVEQEGTAEGTAGEVARADRLGRAASGATEDDPVKVAGLFEQEHWNGRLQAPRRQLEAIAAVRDDPALTEEERERRMRRLRDRTGWLVTFSAKLQPDGPWVEYASRNGLSANPQKSPHSKANANRKGRARLMLSRLPGLRVLSVDLGHRRAAACAVLETMSTEQVREACREAGYPEPREEDLYLLLRKKVAKQKKGKAVEVEETVLYRRIGPDALPDGSPHPAPWARLDRQFFIDLQGEDREAREASNEEIWAVHEMEVELGRTPPLIGRLVANGWGGTAKQRARLEALEGLGWHRTEPSDTAEIPGNASEEDRPSLAVDDLMSSAVRTLDRGLRHHGDRARIAFILTADRKPLPGGRQYRFAEAKDASAGDDKQRRGENRVDYLLDGLCLWTSLFSSPGWKDEEAERLWGEHIATLKGYRVPEDFPEEVSEAEHRKRRKADRELLRPVAEVLASDEALRRTLSDLWRERWTRDDEAWRNRLRLFRDWILPRGKAKGDPAIRRVGGLSLDRLATLTEFRRKVQVGYCLRLHPDGETADPRKTEHFGQRALDALERLREQRVKQLASRIVEAALGVGRVKRPDGGRDPRRPTDRVDRPCHAVVIENLRNYRPEETRTRRENRGLMVWSSSRVAKYLSEGCQLHGLYLREVWAAFTSRQDSRTGAPGMRCQDVPLRDFLRSSFWRKRVRIAKAKQKEGKGDASERFLADLYDHWKDRGPEDWGKVPALRLPREGGELFVSADPKSPAARGLQADLNAAVNIGLRALLDPDWPGAWWSLRCDADSVPLKERTEGSLAEGIKGPLPRAASTEKNTRGPGRTNRGKRGKSPREDGASEASSEEVVLWRDVSGRPLSDPGEWKEHAAYWNGVRYRVVETLRKRAGLGDRRGEGAPANG